MKDRHEVICKMMEKHHSKKLGYFYPTAIRKVEVVRDGRVTEVKYVVGYDAYTCGLDMGAWNFEECFTLGKEDGEIAVAWLKAKKKDEDNQWRENEKYKKRNHTLVTEVKV